jgi:ribosomal protein L18E
MVQPFDYTLKIPAPGEAFLSGVQIGQQQQQVQAQRARAEAERDKQMRLSSFGTEVSSWVKNPTPDGYKELMAKYPEFQQEISAVQKGATAAERPLIRQLAGEALMAHRNKKPEVVLSLIDQRIKAVEDNPVLVKKLEDMKSVYQQYSDNPKLQESMIVTALAQDEEGARIYEKAFKETEPYVAVSGVGIVLRSDIDRAVAAAEAGGRSTVDVKPIIPADAEADLKAGRVSPETFDRVFGAGASAKILGTGGQTATPSGTFQRQ